MTYYPSIASAQASGVVHYWPMNEQSGDEIADIIGGWNGKIVGLDSQPTPTQIANSIVPTPVGYGRNLGVRYAGTERDILPIELLSPAPSLSPLPEISIRIRFFLTSESSGSYQGWSPFGLGYGSGGAVITQFDGSYGLDYEIGTRSGNPGGNPFTVGQWHDLVISAGSDTPTGPGVKIFLNGVEIFSNSSGSGSFDVYRSAGEAIRGCIGGRNVYSGGSLDYSALSDIIVQDFAIWDRAIDLSEAQSLNNAGFAEALTPPPPTDVTFDATAPVAGDFRIYTASAVGFIVDVQLSAAFKVYQDWLSRIPAVQIQEVYRLIVTGSADNLDDMAVGGISGWQATSQAGGRSSYVQAVIPDAGLYLEGLTDRESGDLVIQKGYRLSDGSVRYEEIVRSRFDTLRPDRGQQALTVTVSGYSSGKPQSSGSRVLTGVRSISSPDGKRRVRCDVDLFLQPGMMVTALDETFRADYINYYVGGADMFCEVGER